MSCNLPSNIQCLQLPWEMSALVVAGFRWGHISDDVRYFRLCLSATFLGQVHEGSHPYPQSNRKPDPAQQQVGHISLMSDSHILSGFCLCAVPLYAAAKVLIKPLFGWHSLAYHKPPAECAVCAASKSWEHQRPLTLVASSPSQ